MSRIRIIWLPLSLLLTLCGYVRANGVRGIRDVDFKNQTFPFTANTFHNLPPRIRVRNGLYRSPHQEPSLSYTCFRVAEIVFGNLTRDGQNQAAVVATYRGASSDYYETSVYLFTMRGHRLKLIAILNQESIRRRYERFTHDRSSALFE